MLLDAAEKLVNVQFVFARRGTAQQVNVQYHNVAAAGLDAIEHVAEMIKGIVVADRHENISWACTDAFGGQLAFEGEIELIHFNTRGIVVVAATLRNSEYDVQQYRESTASYGSYRVRKQVDESNQEQSKRDQTEANRNLYASDGEIERNLEIALAGAGVAKNEHGEAINRKAPDDSEGVEVGEKGHIAATDDDGYDLKKYDDVDDAVAGSKTRMRLAKPVAQYAIFRHAIEDAIRTNDGGVYGASKN